MTVRFLSIAETEFTDAAVYYEDKAQGLGDTFIEHITHSIGYIEQNPLIGRLIERRVRQASLKKFPFNIIYYPSDSELVIIAIAHQKRKPDYWRKRVLMI